MKHTQLLIALLVLAVASPLALAQTSALEVTLLSYQPVPANPGDTLTVYVQVANNGDDAAQNVQLEILESSAFTPTGQTTINVGTVAARRVYVASFPVNVKQSAQAGEAQLRVRVRQQGIDWQEHELALSVVPQTDALRIARVTDGQLRPGELQDVTITLENLADTRLRDVRITLTLDDTPFTPLGGSGQQTVATLLPQRSTDVTYQLAAQPSAAADIYRVPVVITYVDELGEQQTLADTIGLQVSAEPRLRAYLDDVSRSGEDVLVTVRLVNNGLSEVRFVETSVGDGAYTIAPQDRESYVGNIDSDDWETLRFSIRTDRSEVQVPLAYAYRDAYNNEHTAETSLTVQVPPQQGGGFGAAWIIAGIAVLVAGIVIWRRRKK